MQWRRLIPYGILVILLVATGLGLGFGLAASNSSTSSTRDLISPFYTPCTKTICGSGVQSTVRDCATHGTVKYCVVITRQSTN
jgi:hypothetical protein